MHAAVSAQAIETPRDMPWSRASATIVVLAWLLMAAAAGNNQGDSAGGPSGEARRRRCIAAGRAAPAHSPPSHCLAPNIGITLTRNHTLPWPAGLGALTTLAHLAQWYGPGQISSARRAPHSSIACARRGSIAQCVVVASRWLRRARCFAHFTAIAGDASSQQQQQYHQQQPEVARPIVWLWGSRSHKATTTCMPRLVGGSSPGQLQCEA